MLYGPEQFQKRNTFHSKFMDGFTGWDIFEDYPAVHEGARGHYPAVNILEHDKDYIIELAAPGFCKEDYVITLEEDVLKIASTKSIDQQEVEKRKYARREFSPRQFEKVFVLPGDADTSKIAASCAEGILNVHVPKKTTISKPASKKINIQ